MYLKTTCLFCIITVLSYSQNAIVKPDSTAHIDTSKTIKNTTRQPDVLSFGLGLGLDYGGLLGVNFTAYPQKNIGLFAGGGIALAGFGYNVGAKLRYVPNNQKRVQVLPFLVGMYGYNTVIVVVNAADYNKLFYGMTVGFGGDIRFKKGCLSLALLIPIRGDDVDNYITDLQNKHNINFQNDLLPVAFSIGYKFILN